MSIMLHFIVVHIKFKLRKFYYLAFIYLHVIDCTILERIYDEYMVYLKAKTKTKTIYKYKYKKTVYISLQRYKTKIYAVKDR